MRGRKPSEPLSFSGSSAEEIDNPRMRGRKLRKVIDHDLEFFEEIDNPRMRGRKLIQDVYKHPDDMKKLIIPG